MSCTEAIVLALASLLKSAEPPALSQSVNLLISARKHLVNVALMPYVKDDMVVRRVENSVESHGKLNDSEVRRKMSAVVRHYADELGAYLLAERVKLILWDLAQIRR